MKYFHFMVHADVPAGKKKYSCQKKEPDALFYLMHYSN
jgi:hypothetical protein